MAKKVTKKSAKKSSKPAKKAAKPVKKPAKKAAKKAAPKAASSMSAARPQTGPVSSGGGASPQEIGAAVVAHINAGAGSDAPLWDKYWSPDFVSIEGMGMQWAGRKDVQAKNDEWMSKHVIHGGSAEGPYVGATGFSIKYKMDVESKEQGRILMEEVGVYTVQNGKVVREEFMYGTVTPVSGGQS
jgi:hypothetical protein